MNYAVIQSGFVVNVVVWDGVAPWNPPEGTELVLLQPDEWVSIGATYDPNASPRFVPAA